jgi:cytochrome c biogenesis protein
MSAIEETKTAQTPIPQPEINKHSGMSSPSLFSSYLVKGLFVFCETVIIVLIRNRIKSVFDISDSAFGFPDVVIITFSASLFALIHFMGVTRLLDILSSVRFGIVLLILLVLASMVGMLIMQQNVEGFDKYFMELTPSQKLLYGKLGFFNIYHAWYFNVLLLTLSLNIVLASIDRFPKAWTFISRKKLDASRQWLKGQEQNSQMTLEGESGQAVAEQVSSAARRLGFKTTISEKGGRTFVFMERGAWNRLGAYAVHVALLTIFLGGFLTAQFGRDGAMWLKPGATTSEMNKSRSPLDETPQVPEPIQLPFTVTCTDIQQKLIRQEGPITANNTLDWLTRIKIKDEYGERDALIHLNTPYDYRGYRFFQASFVFLGRARTITLRLMPQDGGTPQDVTLQRDGSTTLADGTQIVFEDFKPDFTVGAGGKPDTSSGDYNNPAAILRITTPSGEAKRAYAFMMELPEGAPVGAAVGGYKYRLVEFEKVPDAHMLAIQKDPGRLPFYIGGLLLILTLGSVFFFSHQRVWAMIEEGKNGGFETVLGGNTNRNKLGFEDRFKKLTHALNGHKSEA